MSFRLTMTRMTVPELLAQSKNTAQIAKEMFISENTIYTMII